MGIKVYKAQGETIKDNLQLYKENKLQEFSRNHTCSHDGCETSLKLVKVKLSFKYNFVMQKSINLYWTETP